jgi:hypothetical protein
MKIDANIYRVRSNDSQINEILNYDFSAYDNSSVTKLDQSGNLNDVINPVFWRNIVKNNYEAQDYSTFYKKQIDEIINILKDDSKYLPMVPIPIGQYINSYTKNQTLNTVSKIQNIEFNGLIQDELVSNNSSSFLILEEGIRDNDLIVIKENGQIALIGFAINFDNEDREYGRFKLQSVEIGNIGYLYDITKAAVNQSIAAYSVNGQDVQNLDVPVMENIFSGQSVFQIIDTCFKKFFYAVSDIDPYITNRKNYYFAISQFIDSFVNSTSTTPATFGTIFTMLKTLQMYIQYENPEAKLNVPQSQPSPDNSVGGAMNPGFIKATQDYNNSLHNINKNDDLDFTFKWASIDHGEHQTYNAMVASSFQMFIPTFKTINSIFDDVIKNSMYNFHIGYNGTLYVNPPLYNYIPSEMLIYNASFLSWNFNKEHPNYIKYEEVISDDYESKNSELMTRTDAKYIFPFIGEIDYFPTFYIDLKALAKFGFRLNEPYSNPNATVPSLAKLLAMMINITENSMTRKMTIHLKTELIDNNRMTINRFEVGKLYVIEKPENHGKFVGYLLDIDETIKIDDFPTVSLTFSYLRDIEESVPVTSNNIDDILAIYNKYGIFNTLQASSNIDATSFNSSYNEYKNNFLTSIHEKQDFSVGITVPAFKTFPTILDFIQLTYTDVKTQEAVSQLTNQVKETSQSNTTVMVQNSMYYQSFLIKMQRFFDITKNNALGANDEISSDILTENNKYNNYTDLQLNPQIPTDNRWYNNSYKTFIQNNKSVNHQNYNFTLYNNKNNLNIANFMTNFQTTWSGYITQELFNRIVECDADFQDRPNNFSLVDFYDGPPENFVSNTSGFEAALYQQICSISDINSIPLKWRYKDIGSNTWEQSNNLAGQLFFPQRFVNMDFLQQNIVLGLATSDDKQSIIGKTETQSNLFQAHLDGRAIDIVIPEKGTSTCLYLNSNWLNIDNNGNVLNTMTYNDYFYNYIENLFKTHFDIVKVHNNQILDLTKFNIKFPKQSNPTQYLARIYHLEVSSKKYLQLQTELFSNGSATNLIERLL